MAHNQFNGVEGYKLEPDQLFVKPEGLHLLDENEQENELQMHHHAFRLFSDLGDDHCYNPIHRNYICDYKWNHRNVKIGSSHIVVAFDFLQNKHNCNKNYSRIE